MGALSRSGLEWAVPNFESLTAKNKELQLFRLIGGEESSLHDVQIYDGCFLIPSCSFNHVTFDLSI